VTAPFPPPITPMEAKVREQLPPAPGWAYEPKWDGFRMVARNDPARIDSRNQRPLLRYFPELEPLVALLPDDAVVDGEVVIVRDGKTDFDALQNRLHPADSRIRKLSMETPASLIAFDCLAAGGRDLRGAPFTERRAALEALFAGPLAGSAWHLTPSTTDRDTAAHWFTAFESAGCDGIVAKQLDGPYVEGERAMVKVKHRRTIDCVIGGYREHKDGGKIGSLLLGLHNDAGELHFIGHCSGFGDADRVAILERLLPLVRDRSFGTGARQPGQDSRWSGDKDMSWTPVATELVCEVSYDQLTGERFRHATRFERWRPDKDPAQCRMDQLERPDGPDFEDVVVA
jgi:ATP-dependent DNA ligase